MDTNDIQPPDSNPIQPGTPDRRFSGELYEDAPYDFSARPLTRKRSRLRRAVMWAVVTVCCVGMLGFLVLLAFPPELDMADEDIARTKAQTIAQEAEKYYVNHGDWPASIVVLTQPDPVIGNQVQLQPQQILDPWNQPYQLYPPVPPIIYPRVVSTHRAHNGGEISNY